MNGDCLVKLQELDDNSVDSIVTDPPYGIDFMGKKWDYDVPSVEIWEQCLRVLKPGGYLLAFAGTRTQHRMAVRIEDAGFEIRDMIAWVYGSGFPKSHNIGKNVDKTLGNDREVIGTIERGSVEKAIEKGAGYTADPANQNNKAMFGYGTETVTKGNTEWEGWGTALKPALEPITVARKPLGEKTVAANVLKYGTGGINIDESRVPSYGDKLGGGSKDKHNFADKEGWDRPWMHDEEHVKKNKEKQAEKVAKAETIGRFPANLIHDGSDDVLELFPDTGIEASAARFFYVPKTSKKDRNDGLENFTPKATASSEFRPNHAEKADNGEDGNPYGRWTPTQNNHPTVKPTDLMRYLVTMVTPEGGTTLDPFMGSGSTGRGAKLGGFNFIGIELDPDYLEIAKARIDAIIEESTLEEFFA